MGNAMAFTQTISEVAAEYDYLERDLGIYVQPVVYGGACHFECNFYYDPDNAEEVDRIKDLYTEAAKVVLDMGGFFSRPYGPVADMVYQRTSDYTAELKKIKKLKNVS